MYGWAGTILKAYLSDGKVVKDPLNPEFGGTRIQLKNNLR